MESPFPPAFSKMQLASFNFAFEDIGEQRLKNIARTARIYRTVMKTKRSYRNWTAAAA